MLRPLAVLTLISTSTLAGLSLAPGTSATSPISIEDELLQNASLVFSRAVHVPAAAIPAAVLMRATGIVVVPAAMNDGDRYRGKGVMSARGARPDVWTAPAVISVEAGIPLNLESSTLDFVIVAQSRRGLDYLTQPRYASDRAILAGALGHNTPPDMTADLLAYAQFGKYFAGVTIDRWVLQEMTGSNQVLYGRPYSTDDIVRGAGFFHLPPAARMWREALAAYFREMS